MTKPKTTKTRTVKPAPKEGQVSKDKVAKAVEKVLHTPESSKAAKTAKGSALTSKVKKLTLKDQLAEALIAANGYQSLYNTVLDSYKKQQEEVAYKQIDWTLEKEALNKKIKELKEDFEQTLMLKEHFFNLAMERDTKISELKEQLTPWYTKVWRFLKGE